MADGFQDPGSPSMDLSSRLHPPVTFQPPNIWYFRYVTTTIDAKSFLHFIVAAPDACVSVFFKSLGFYIRRFLVLKYHILLTEEYREDFAHALLAQVKRKHAHWAGLQLTFLVGIPTADQGDQEKFQIPPSDFVEWFLNDFCDDVIRHYLQPHMPVGLSSY